MGLGNNLWSNASTRNVVVSRSVRNPSVTSIWHSQLPDVHESGDARISPLAMPCPVSSVVTERKGGPETRRNIKESPSRSVASTCKRSLAPARIGKRSESRVSWGPRLGVPPNGRGAPQAPTGPSQVPVASLVACSSWLGRFAMNWIEGLPDLTVIAIPARRTLWADSAGGMEPRSTKSVESAYTTRMPSARGGSGVNVPQETSPSSACRTIE